MTSRLAGLTGATLETAPVRLPRLRLVAERAATARPRSESGSSAPRRSGARGGRCTATTTGACSARCSTARRRSSRAPPICPPARRRTTPSSSRAPTCSPTRSRGSSSRSSSRRSARRATRARARSRHSPTAIARGRRPRSASSSTAPSSRTTSSPTSAFATLRTSGRIELARLELGGLQPVEEGTREKVLARAGGVRARASARSAPRRLDSASHERPAYVVRQRCVPKHRSISWRSCPTVNASPTSEPTFVLCVESGIYEVMAVRAIESLRTFGGSFADCDVLVMTSRLGPPLARSTRNEFAKLGVRTCFRPRLRHDWFPWMGKVWAAIDGERLAATETVAFVDCDVLFLREPTHLSLPPEAVIAIGYPDHGLVGTTGRAPATKPHGSAPARRSASRSTISLGSIPATARSEFASMSTRASSSFGKAPASRRSGWNALSSSSSTARTSGPGGSISMTRSRSVSRSFAFVSASHRFPTRTTLGSTPRSRRHGTVRTSARSGSCTTTTSSTLRTGVRRSRGSRRLIPRSQRG